MDALQYYYIYEYILQISSLGVPLPSLPRRQGRVIRFNLLTHSSPKGFSLLSLTREKREVFEMPFQKVFSKIRYKTRSHLIVLLLGSATEQKRIFCRTLTSNFVDLTFLLPLKKVIFSTLFPGVPEKAKKLKIYFGKSC